MKIIACTNVVSAAHVMLRWCMIAPPVTIVTMAAETETVRGVGDIEQALEKEASHDEIPKC
ncbi:hypothetical protein [Sagittula sp. SSi028]|uniref:hypothetical protein n=1 Tax=Sagittula sp. SSi028 TaxID=3400636 RepID=UPI003AF4A4B0